MSKLRIASTLIVCASVALWGLLAQASATIITITETGQVFGGGDNTILGRGLHSLAQLHGAAQ